MKNSERLYSTSGIRLFLKYLKLLLIIFISDKDKKNTPLKLILVFVLTLVCSAASFGQTDFFQGYVLDKNTQEPLSYAHIVIEGTGYGTVSNREGYFRYNLPENIDFPVEVTVSFVGYNCLNMTINDNKPRIFQLTPEDAVLPEIVVEAEFVHELLENAFHKISDNYPDDDSRYKGFYRQTLFKEDTVVYMGEAFIDSYKSSYEKNVSDSQIEILRFRKFTGSPNYEDSIKFYGGVFNTYLADYVKLRGRFLNPRFFDLFDYTYEQKIPFRNEMHFKINFDHIETNAGGSILINENDLGYANVFFESLDSIYTEGFFRGYSSANVNYARLNGKYYLYNYDINIYYVNLLTGEPFVFNAVYTVTDANLTDASPIPYNDIVKYRGIFMDSPVDTSRTFWEDYNIIEDDYPIKHFISKYEPAQPKKKSDFSANLSRFAERFSFQFTFGYHWWSNYLYPNKLVAFENQGSEAERATYVYEKNSSSIGSFSFGINLTRRSFINYYLSSEMHSKGNFTNHELSYLYRSRIKHYGNPMFLDVGAGLSFFKHEQVPVFKESSQSFPFILRTDDIIHTGIDASSVNLEAQIAYFPQRFLAVVLNAKVGYLYDYNWFYKHNEERMPDINYKALNKHEETFMTDRLKPSVTIGVRFYPLEAF